MLFAIGNSLAMPSETIYSKRQVGSVRALRAEPNGYMNRQVMYTNLHGWAFSGCQIN